MTKASGSPHGPGRVSYLRPFCFAGAHVTRIRRKQSANVCGPSWQAHRMKLELKSEHLFMKLSKTSLPVVMWQRIKPKAGGCRSDNLSVESSPRRVTTRPDPHFRWWLFWTQRGSRVPARATWILVVACVIVALGALSPAEGLGGSGQAGASTGYGPRFANLGETLYGYTGQTIREPAVGMTPTPDAGGYWLVGTDGGVFAFGDAQFLGSTGGIHLNQPIVGMAQTPDGDGYWLVASDGGIFSFGDARFFGSTGGIHLNLPIVGMAPTPDGGGYWLVASDGGIFSFGDAQFYGSTGSIHLNQPIVGMATTYDGGGYSLVASDGGIFSFGDAHFYGSTGGIHLNQPIVGMALTPDGRGYWLVASDGGIFSFGNAQFFGSEASAGTGVPIIGMQSSETGLGYSLIGQHGQIYPFGDAGVPTTADSVVSAIRGEISTSLDPDVTALVSQQAPGNPNGLWIGGDPAYWFSSSGPGLAAAAVAAATGDPTMRADAEQTFDTLIAEHEQPNGSFIAVSHPQSPDISTMFFVTNLGMALWALRPQMSPGEVASWTAAIAAGANYLVNNGNLTWYTNGNIVIGNTLDNGARLLGHRKSRLRDVLPAGAVFRDLSTPKPLAGVRAHLYQDAVPSRRVRRCRLLCRGWRGHSRIRRRLHTASTGPIDPALSGHELAAGTAPGESPGESGMAASGHRQFLVERIGRNATSPARPLHPLHLPRTGVERVRRWPVVPDALSPAAGGPGRNDVLRLYDLLEPWRPERLRSRSSHLRAPRSMTFLMAIAPRCMTCHADGQPRRRSGSRTRHKRVGGSEWLRQGGPDALAKVRRRPPAEQIGGSITAAEEHGPVRPTHSGRVHLDPVGFPRLDADGLDHLEPTRCHTGADVYTNGSSISDYPRSVGKRPCHVPYVNVVTAGGEIAETEDPFRRVGALSGNIVADDAGDDARNEMGIGLRFAYGVKQPKDGGLGTGLRPIQIRQLLAPQLCAAVDIVRICYRLLRSRLRGWSVHGGRGRERHDRWTGQSASGGQQVGRAKYVHSHRQVRAIIAQGDEMYCSQMKHDIGLCLLHNGLRSVSVTQIHRDEVDAGQRLVGQVLSAPSEFVVHDDYACAASRDQFGRQLGPYESKAAGNQNGSFHLFDGPLVQLSANVGATQLDFRRELQGQPYGFEQVIRIELIAS